MTDRRQNEARLRAEIQELERQVSDAWTQGWEDAWDLEGRLNDLRAELADITGEPQ